MKTLMFPGQGSQYKGMGKELFDRYPSETARASAILGYDIKKLCLEDPEKKLNNTEFTQPALYVVNSLGYREFLKNDSAPDFLIGHSLGEYNALQASGVFDFETGLKLVKKRGKLMAAAKNGGMAVVLGCDIETIKKILHKGYHEKTDIANYNTPSQTVLSGPVDGISEVLKDFENEGIKVVPLNVSAAFHSRYMDNASQLFRSFLDQFEFFPMQIPVISNKNATRYDEKDAKRTLSDQISHSVLWTDTILYLLNKGVTHFEEIGGQFLTKMVTEVKTVYDKNIIKQNWIQKKRRLFLLPFAGGNRYSYQFLQPYLEDFEWVPLELPGRGKRHKESLLDSFYDAMGDIYRQISTEIDTEHDVIYGHSLGAILGHWVTYRLEKAGKNPARLIVSGVPRPTIIDTDALKVLHQLPQKEFAERLIAMGGMPQTFIDNHTFFEYAEPILRADFKLLDSVSNYNGSRIKTPITAIMGTKETYAHKIEEWRNYSHGDIEFHHLEGGHFFINDHPETLSKLISKSL
ncbi:ACP S-malonyltransferase [Chryseobacterium sp. MYb264]|uniref:ACP S-malonyltransferase n=1 Tax=Chryseobacterium sp. MYb264 TaxID=2745153 RepID=UPI002E14FCEB|nr:ACP S-malonyltransferase [Chryseobacterium sp. MYb264]